MIILSRDCFQYVFLSFCGWKIITGSFSHQFPMTGIFYYWSGYINEFNTILSRGKIEVIDKPSFSNELQFKIGDYEAVYKSGEEYQF